MSELSDRSIPESRLSPELLRTAGYWLHLVREIEATGRRLYLQGRLPGSFYDGRGQEATAIGAALAMAERDVACPLIRDMGVHLVRGVTPAEMLRHYLGKTGAPMEGADGNIHLGAIDRGTIPMISHLPEMLPVGMGVALGRSWRGEDSAALCFCGDGASAGGVWHETMNLAAVWKAPLVIVLERNGWAYMTPESHYLPVESLTLRAAGYGAASWTVDGNDVAAVYTVVTAALEHARARQGPAVVEARTYRMHGHGAHDSQRYMPKTELEHWAGYDPLLLWRRRAETEADWTEEDQRELDERIRAEVAAALADATAAPYPDADALSQRVFAP
ncbi:MAG TPA: thiamine pyrophosphate-dependent dehydrogenase E1 component subunit alpha [Gaiellaceae bacterium]|jgi:TPP-dependent pyruvate/acetoin dehydrogenase alpha subunit